VRAQEFLEVALPTAGLYCLVNIKNGVVRHSFTTGISELLTRASAYDADGYDCYFACATFSEKERKQEHAFKLKSFFFDIDIGADKASSGKGYAAREEGVTALKSFCQKLHLPKPSIIDSGRGMHVYWTMENEVPVQQWQPVASALKQAALDNDLYIDPAVPADSARILRIPGTNNYKGDDPKPVRVLTTGRPVSIGQVWESVKSYEVKRPAFQPTKRTLDPVTQALLGNYSANFAKLARRSIKGEGCNQITHILKNKEDQAYDLWTAALTIAVHCEDGDTAIHKISKGHPDYDPKATIEKANSGFHGPRTCAWYKTMSGHGSLCNGCAQSITSPIQLGRVVNTHEGEIVSEVKVEVQEDAEVPSTGIATLSIPEMPFPYFRGKNGGIYRKSQDPDADDALVYEHDLFIVKRMVDPVYKDCVTFRLHLPHDPVREFTVPVRDTQSIDKFRDILSDHSIVTSKAQLQNLMGYTNAFVNNLLRKMKAEEARTQFGWVDANTKFIVGTREIAAGGASYSPPSKVTTQLAPFMDPVGDYAEWRAAFNMYVGYPGAEPQVFALMTAFGAPLMKFSGTPGALVSLVNTTSGTGKTSTLRLVNSVWGHPDKLTLIQDDKLLAKIHRLGVMGNLPVTVDEVTNETPDNLSDFAYTVTQGRGRNRMRSDVNEERINRTTWSTICTCTGNASVLDKLAANKATSEGEMMRVLEFTVSLVDVEGAYELLNSLHENYGHAGSLYAQALVKNANKLPALLDNMRAKVINALGAHAKERFWVNTISVTLVGATIAKRLGLHDYDLEGLFRWAVTRAKSQRASTVNRVVDNGDILGEFLMENHGQVLVVSDKLNVLTNSTVVKPAIGRICARFEADKGSLFIAKKELRDYCVKRQADMDAILQYKKGDYHLLGSSKKRMSTGTGVSAPAVEVFEFLIHGELRDELGRPVEQPE